MFLFTWLYVLDKWTKLIPEMEELVNHLRARGWRVVIVTASPKWIVEPGALRLGLGRDDVLGIEVRPQLVLPPCEGYKNNVFVYFCSIIIR